MFFEKKHRTRKCPEITAFIIFTMECVVSGSGDEETYTVGDAANRVAVVPHYGGIVNELVLHGRSVVAGYASFEDMRTFHFARSMKLSPFPNRIADGRYAFRGREYAMPINKPAENNAIHGILGRRAFAVAGHDIAADGRSATIALRCRYAGDVEGYPFPYTLTIAYTVTSDGVFTASSEARNDGPAEMPLGDGWHPYFRLGGPVDGWRIRLPTAKMFVTDSRLIPTGEFAERHDLTELAAIGDTRIDAVFKLDSGEGACPGSAETVLENDSTRLTIRQDTGPRGYNYIVMFIPPWREAVAIEPMTCATNAFNTGEGVFTLGPGDSWSAGYSVACTALK